MFLIEHPDSSIKETRYIAEVIFGEFLDIPFELKVWAGKDIRISHGEKYILIKTDYLAKLHQAVNHFPKITSAPTLWDSASVNWEIRLTDRYLPVLFGEPYAEECDTYVKIGIDIFGAAFYMLAGVEELSAYQQDRWGRYPARESSAYKFYLLKRPVIDECVELLKAAMRRLWPDISFRKHIFRVIPTHDVDNPYLNLALPTAASCVKRIGGDLIVRHNPAVALRTVAGWLKWRLSGNAKYPGDPFDTYNTLMNLSEDAGVKSEFYFMSLKEAPENAVSGRYDIADIFIQEILENILSRGHNIGFHPTGDSYLNGEIFRMQADHLRETITALGGDQNMYGGRQHYLRWRRDTTPYFWEENGFDFDSTLGYAECVGFRCGTCREFSLWDHRQKKKMRLRERPLIMMEGSLRNPEGRALGFEEARETIKSVRNACKTVNGNFVFLWHNSNLSSKWDWELYKACLYG